MKLKKYDPSGEGNLTESRPPQVRGKVICDSNQQPKYTARRNHPRVIQRASCSLYYGANSDIQRHLISNLGDQSYEPNDEMLNMKLIFLILTCPG